MNIELRFLDKAINDKNFISFVYEKKDYKKVKAIKLINKEDKYFLQSTQSTFEFDKIKKLQILKDRF
jgi:hypothetical protein